MSGIFSPAGDSRDHLVPCRFHPARRHANHSGLCDQCEADRDRMAEDRAEAHLERQQALLDHVATYVEPPEVSTTRVRVQFPSRGEPQPVGGECLRVVPQ